MIFFGGGGGWGGRGDYGHGLWWLVVRGGCGWLFLPNRMERDREEETRKQRIK